MGRLGRLLRFSRVWSLHRRMRLLIRVWFFHHSESRSLPRIASLFNFRLNNIYTRREKHDIILQSRLNESLIDSLLVVKVLFQLQSVGPVVVQVVVFVPRRTGFLLALLCLWWFEFGLRAIWKLQIDVVASQAGQKFHNRRLFLESQAIGRVPEICIYIDPLICLLFRLIMMLHSQ